ncbi:MAG: hypothetical protein JKX81_06920, partial [Arenicella sp.]|nr:hypothetical protein [Arenicella sp.]
FSSPELVDSIKVISDNQEHSVESLNAAKITQLMQTHVSMVNRFTDSLQALAEPSEIAVIELNLEGVRRTHSQQLQLNRLLEKAAALQLNQAVLDLALHQALEFADVLSKLTKLIEGSAPPLNRSQVNKAESSQLATEVQHG